MAQLLRGDVVLPLLKEAIVTPGWVSEDAFLAGYGAAQALPGPLFTFGAYLGAMTGGVPGRSLASSRFPFQAFWC
jgi:chromate transporter